MVFVMIISAVGIIILGLQTCENWSKIWCVLYVISAVVEILVLENLSAGLKSGMNIKVNK